MRLMIKGLMTLVCGCALFGIALAAEPIPRAELAEAEFEFDAVVEGTLVKHDFVVRNTGDAPLVFGTIKSG